MTDDADADLDTDAIDRLHEHLAATAERPVERTASRWLGEAEAVAADARHIDDSDVARERIEEVAELLSHVEGTGDDEADEHVRAATQLAEQLTDAGND